MGGRAAARVLRVARAGTPPPRAPGADPRGPPAVPGAERATRLRTTRVGTTMRPCQATQHGDFQGIWGLRLDRSALIVYKLVHCKLDAATWFALRARAMRGRRPGLEYRRGRFFSADLAPAFEGLRKRHLVGVLEIAAHREPAGDPRDADSEGAEQLRQVQRRRLALDVGIGRQDHLARLATLEPYQEFLDLEVVGADAVEGREGAEQHVVAPTVLARPLHRQEVVRLLDDAEQLRVARGIGADPAGILIGDVEAGATGDDPVLHREERFRELAHLLDWALEQEEREPLSRLRPDAGQPLQRPDQPRNRFRVVHP